jgi:hypothetical protein
MKIIIFTLSILFVACNHDASFIAIDKEKIGHIKNVLIMGNSIVRHPPLPEIGWSNNWGMAASSIDSDFVHILKRKLSPYNVNLVYDNYADFESHYWDYDYSKFDTLKRFNPDMIIVRLAENVNDSMSIPKGFIKHYDSLLNYIDPEKSAVKIICDGWWANNNINRLLKDYAEENDYTFLDHNSLYSNNTIALGEYKNAAVEQHPSNKGMALIAESIWGAIGVYFK